MNEDGGNGKRGRGCGRQFKSRTPHLDAAEYKQIDIINGMTTADQVDKFMSRVNQEQDQIRARRHRDTLREIELDRHMDAARERLKQIHKDAKLDAIEANRNTTAARQEINIRHIGKVVINQ